MLFEYQLNSVTSKGQPLYTHLVAILYSFCLLVSFHVALQLTIKSPLLRQP